jgi:hypothetical protein
MSNTLSDKQVTIKVAEALFWSCYNELGQIPDEDRDENDEGVWFSPLYYQTAHAAEQVIRHAVAIISRCLYIIEGLREKDYPVVSDYQAENLGELRSMLRLFINHLYRFFDEGNEEDVTPNDIFLRKLDALLKDAG